MANCDEHVEPRDPALRQTTHRPQPQAKHAISRISGGRFGLSFSDDAELAKGDSSTEHIDTIARKAGRGLTWTLVGTLITKMGSFALGLVMARLLTPADFGVFAVALAVTAFAITFNDAGIVAACVQWRGKLEDMAPTGASIALLSSVFVYGVLWLAAPAFATLAGVPEAVPVMRLLSRDDRRLTASPPSGWPR